MTRDPQVDLDNTLLAVLAQDPPRTRYDFTVQRIRIGEHWTTVAMLRVVGSSVPIVERAGAEAPALPSP